MLRDFIIKDMPCSISSNGFPSADGQFRDGEPANTPVLAAESKIDAPPEFRIIRRDHLTTAHAGKRAPEEPPDPRA